MKFLRSLKANFMKTKRTPFRYIILLVPILFSLLFVSYISVYKRDYTFQLKVYEIYFGVVSLTLPLISAILIGLNIMGEESSGEFRGLLMTPISRSTIYLSKLFMIILVTIIDMFVSLFILLIGMKFLYPLGTIQYGVFLTGTILTILGCLFLYGLYIIISLKFGIGATIAVGVGGSIIGALLQTGLGDTIWPFVPFAWSGRISTVPIYKLSNFIKYQHLENQSNIQEILNTTFKQYMCLGVPIAIISFIIICVIGVLWFNKWEGRKAIN
ncbi:lantibiotic immunity ABC transporter MutG family permease subunit [Clostridium botulinum]|uniref:lantibiotic immunity ABC transporter MutG family permease subunit n=1 Tax=Clostridium botulinum TaxID=1491 RepID=UPI0006A45FE8|nr:lantibiotic immunity ABC transporter MutG family permease subunit [Clostridium botulinum]KOC31706.1 lantibiotic ABC transporter permease [Clostridium botulinum]